MHCMRTHCNSMYIFVSVCCLYPSMHEYDDCTTSIGQPIVCSCVLCLRDSQSALSQLGFMGWQRHVPRDNDPDALTELLSEVQENPSLMGRGLEDEDMYSVTDGLFDD